ncbi:MAG: hypothetical protein KDB80_12420, partial [Planctomycetes bacterium]|nr:hypothetical protein [Planctomycetota bacterium]
MCGILGALESKFDAARFEAALARLAWRGRDGSGSTSTAGWRLGTARLAISDATAPQPIECPRTGRVVVFNGAVTSARDEWARYRTATRNDAELLLHRLAHDGPEGLLDMTGPYAFAIADPLADCVYVGRDHLGEKPLLVASEDGEPVAFASTGPALRALGFRTEWNPVELGRWFRR